MLSRTFNWSVNLLFPEEIPNLVAPHRTAFFLAGRDSILNAERVRKYLLRHGVEEAGEEEHVGPDRGGLKLHPENKHGESMIGTGPAFSQCMAWVVRESDEEDFTSATNSDA